MNIEKLSTKYHVKCLTSINIPAIYELCLSNPLYYQYCPPMVTHDSIAKDMVALPPGKTSDDKYYLGFYRGLHLVAVVDLILKYPVDTTAFIGFFMVHANAQGVHIGSSIISELTQAMKTYGYQYVRLAFVEGNPQSEHFWKKNGFHETGIAKEQERYRVVVLEKKL